MEIDNKENFPMKKQQATEFSFLSCSEIFCESLINPKQNQSSLQNEKPSFHEPLCPKLLQVKAQIDPSLTEDKRVILNLLKSEQRYLPKYPDYFRTVQAEVKPHMRKIVSDWMLEVCQELGCPPEVFCLAMNLMDRFLAKCKIKKSELQLLGAVCLFLSSKFKESSPIPSEKLVMYTDFSVGLEAIREWELFVLYKLKWDLGAATGLDYLDHVLPKLPLEATLDRQQFRRQTETVIALSATHYLFSYVRPSVLAASAAAVCLRSAVGLGQAGPALAALQQLTKADRGEVEACSAALLSTLPDFLPAPPRLQEKPGQETPDCLLSNFSSAASLLVKTC